MRPNRSSAGIIRACSLALVSAIAGGGAQAFAQAPGSAPVGVMSYATGENSTVSLGVPLLRPAVLVGTVATVNGASLTLATTDVATLITGESYFAEVVGHADNQTTLVGHRFEIDEDATRAAAAGTLVLDLGSAHNTGPSSVAGGLGNYRIAVRPHWTLAALFGTGTGAKVNAAASAATADQVLAWNGAGFSVFYLRSGETPQWRNISTGPVNQDGAIIPPGTGVYLRRRAGEFSLRIAGEVRTNAFVRPAFGASQLVANAFPTGSTPTDWKLNAGTGLTAGTSPANSDQLLTWSGNAFSMYYLRSGTTAPEWRNTATGLVDHARASVFQPGGATLLLLRAPATGTAPAQLVQAVPFSL
jgi:hypothetical protein